jgi:DNA repair exonuclease SbcCD ATPase subunit
MTSVQERLDDVEAEVSNVAGTAEIKQAVRAEIAATKADLNRMVAEVLADIKRIEEQAQRADVLLEAKRHANANAERSARNLMEQVQALKEELAAGDQETKQYYDELKAELEKKIEESNKKLKRMTTRWMESGVM